jgi:hypothetical protein
MLYADEVIWNGEDDQGRRVSSGVYLVRLENGSDSQTDKIIFIR